MGKSAVWRELVDRARHKGWLVLTCAPTESESSLALAALADLLRPLTRQVADLPGPQRAAVRAALLTASSDTAVDERALAAATRSLLEAAAASDRRVLVAVDDAPWLDPASERALAYVSSAKLEAEAGAGVGLSLSAEVFKALRKLLPAGAKIETESESLTPYFTASQTRPNVPLCVGSG